MKNVIRIAVYIVILVQPSYGLAQDSYDESLLKLLGVRESLQQIKDIESEFYKNRVESVLHHLTSSTDLSQTTKRELKLALEKYTSDIHNSWSVNDAATVFLESWKTQSAGEISDIQSRLNNPEIQKLLQVALEAQKQLNSYIYSRNNQVHEKSYAEFLSNVDKLLE